MRLYVNSQELNTIFAALRYYQDHSQGEPLTLGSWINNIATNAGREPSLDDQAIDDLIQRLNCRGVIRRRNTVASEAY